MYLSFRSSGFDSRSKPATLGWLRVVFPPFLGGCRGVTFAKWLRRVPFPPIFRLCLALNLSFPSKLCSHSWTAPFHSHYIYILKKCLYWEFSKALKIFKQSTFITFQRWSINVRMWTSCAIVLGIFTVISMLDSNGTRVSAMATLIDDSNNFSLLLPLFGIFKMV